MKNIKHIMPLLLFLLVSCTNDDKDFVGNVSVTFNPAVQAKTRVSGIYPTDVPFGVWACELRNGSWEDNRANSVIFMDDVQTSYDGNTWQPLSPYYWKGNAKFTFMGYSPYGCGAVFSSENGITFENYDVTSGVELLFTAPVADFNYRTAGSCVPLTFIHALAEVEFCVRSMAAEDSIIRVKSLVVDGVAYKGNFRSLPQPAWDVTNDAMSLQFCNSETEVPESTLCVGAHTVVPQNISFSASLLVDIYDKEGNLLVADRTITSHPMDAVWGVGKYYAYTLNVTSNDVSFTTDFIEMRR